MCVCVKACRGKDLDDGMEVSDDTSEPRFDADFLYPDFADFLYPDFLYAYSNAPGLYLCIIVIYCSNNDV